VERDAKGRPLLKRSRSGETRKRTSATGSPCLPRLFVISKYNCGHCIQISACCLFGRFVRLIGFLFLDFNNFPLNTECLTVPSETPHGGCVTYVMDLTAMLSNSKKK